MTWTKTSENTGVYGYGTQPYGSSPYGGQTEITWTKTTDDTATWTTQPKAEE